MSARVARLRRLVAAEGGYTLIELLQVTVILGVILGALTVLFVNASNAELEMNRRFQAQQAARVAVDRMRREVHCASAVSPAGTSSSIAVTIPAQCPTAGGTPITVVYDTQPVGTSRYELRRAGVRVADYVTEPNVFSFSAVSERLATLRVNLPINTKPADASKEWRLVGDIVLRNSPRTP